MTNQDWYSPSEIRYMREQCIWVIEHLDSLESGIYPPEHKETGYSGKPKGGINRRASFDNPCCIAAEISRRLKLTRTDGKLLKAQVQGGITDYEELEPEAQMALNFISIFDFRKRQKYSWWKRDKWKYYRQRTPHKCGVRK